MSKKTCTPRRRALAMRFKKGDIHRANVRRRGMAGGGVVRSLRYGNSSAYGNGRMVT